MRDGNAANQKIFPDQTRNCSFRSDYEGWKLVMILKCSLSILIVLEVTMRDGNTCNQSQNLGSSNTKVLEVTMRDGNKIL